MFVIGLIGNPMVRISFAIIFSLLAVAFLAYQLKTGKHNGLKICHAFFFTGCLANFTVLFANGCRMPSLSKIYYDDSFWVPMTQATYYNFLGDRFASFSIGDFFLLTGLVVLVILGISQIFRNIHKKE